MKKVLSAILVLLLLCSMAACDNATSIEGTMFTTEPSITEKLTDSTTLVTEPATEPSAVPTTEPTTVPVTEPSTEPATESDTGDIRPDFKTAMDSYEAFFDEYVAIMNKYKENPMDMSILSDYANYMGQYADMMQKFEQWESEDLNAAELAYYIDVQARITKKLLEVA